MKTAEQYVQEFIGQLVMQLAGAQATVAKLQAELTDYKGRLEITHDNLRQLQAEQK